MSGKLTATQERILARMIELAGQGTWHTVPSQTGATIRYTRTIETPDYHRGDGFGRWPEATYDRHLFLTLMRQGVIAGDASAPWMGRSDSPAPYWLVELVLAAEDPLKVWDERLELKRARNAGVRGDGVRGYR
jgi:hypothetical protein